MSALLLALTVPAHASAASDFTIPSDLAAHAILSCKDLKIAGSSVVTASGLGGAAAGGQGHVRSNGDVALDGSVEVHGDAIAGPGRRVRVSGQPLVTGEQRVAAAPYACAPIDVAAVRSALEGGHDNHLLSTTDKGKPALSGPSGRTLDLSGNDGVTLPAGTYLFDALKLAGNSRVRVDGPVRVLVTGTIDVKGGSHLNLDGSPYRLRIWSAGTNVSIASQSNLFGFLYAPAAAVQLAGQSRVAGGVQADQVELTGGSRVRRVVDDAPPLLTVTRPTDGESVSVCEVPVSGTVRDAESGVVLTVNGVAVVPGEDGAFATTTTLWTADPGLVEVVATDQAGNSTRVAVRVAIVPPIVELASPSPGSLVGSRVVDLVGSSGTATEVSVDGRPATVVGDGTWHLTGFDLGAQDGLVTLALASRNCGGSASATAVIDLDTLPPAVAIDSPSAGDLFGTTPITVAGTVDDAHLDTVRVGTVVARVEGKRFVAEGVALVEGVNTLRAVAVDALGRSTTSAPVAVELDSTAPTATIDEPASGAVVATPNVTVRGVVSDPNLASVRVNGVSASVSGTSFTATVPLVEGENALVAVARDNAGNEAESPRVIVVLDTLPPVLTLDAASLPGLTGEIAVTVGGTVTDPHLESVTVAGVVATVSGDRWVAADVPLVEGSNTLVARAVDTLGHAVESAAAVVVRDTQAPAVAITEPAADAQLLSRTVTVRGTVADPHLERVSVGAVEAVVTGSTFEAPGVELPEGRSELVAHARDTLGHVATSAPVPVVVDTLAPVVSLDSPQNPLVATPSVTVTGRAEDPNLSAVSVAGLAAEVDAEGRFSVADVPLAEGPNEVVAVASDSFGHEATSEPVLYVLDTTEPAVTITAPAAGEVVRELSVTVTGTVTDAHLDTVLVQAGDAEVEAVVDEATGAFSATVPLVAGANTLTVRAADRAGNASEAAVTVSVVLDAEPPLLTIDHPSVGSAACLPTGGAHTLGGVYRDDNPPPADAVGPAVAVLVVDAAGARRSYPATLDVPAGRWSASGVDLGTADGVVQVRVTAADAYGNAASTVASFRLDGTPPVVRLLLDGAPFPGAAAGAAPPAGAAPVLIGRQVAVTAVVEDGGAAPPPPATLLLDGAPHASGAPIASEGQHLLVASATDCAGRTAAVHALFTLDLTPPALRSTSPAQGARLTVAPTTFSGVSDPDLARATVAGRPAALGAAGAFSLAGFPWKEGPQEVAIELEDRAGHRSTHRVRFEVKTVPLSLQLLESGVPITPGAVFLRPVRPEVRPSDSTATVTATLSGAPFVSGSEIAQGGSYTLAATASDDWGRSASAQVSFIVDLTAGPEIAITAPEDGAVLGEARARVAGTVRGEGAVSVIVNGVAATITGSPATGASWEVASLPLEPEAMTPIVAIARDGRGRTATDGVTVAVATGAPQVLILEPATGTTTNRTRIDVAGAVVGGASRSADGTVTVAGTSPGSSQTVTLLPDGTFRALDVPLATGANTLTAAVTDARARTGTASVTVTADFTPPAIAFSVGGQPLVDGATFPGPVTVAIEVADDAALAAPPRIRVSGAPFAGAALPRTEIAFTESGGYVVAVAVADAAGNEARAERSFVLSAGGCSLTDVSPPAGSGVTGASVSLVGRAGAAERVAVRVPQPGGGVQEYVASLADGTFLLGDVPLPATGSNALELVCTGSGGASRSVPHPIERLAAGQGPVIVITEPIGGAVTSAAAIPVAGTVSSGAVSVNGVAAVVAAGASGGNTFRAASVPLAEGPNPLLARALDAAGRSGEDRVVVHRDSQAPRLQITRPDNRTRIGVAGSGPASVDVSGVVDLDSEPHLDRVVVTSSVGGETLGSVVAVVDRATGVFLAAGVPLDAAAGAEVEQTLTAAATDTLGQSGSSSVVVMLDPAGPAISLAEPADLLRFGVGASGPLTVRGEVWGAPGTAVSVNGLGLDPASLAWDAPAADGRRRATFTTSITLPTSDGPFGLIARATDLAGRVAQDRRLLYRDTQGPRVVEMVPADGSGAVDGNGLLLVLFSEPIRHASLDLADGLTLVRSATGQAVVGVKTVAGQAVAFAPGSALVAGESYLFRAGLGITDVAGNPLVAAAESRFTVATSRAAAAPSLAALPASVCASELQVRGTAAPSATLKVRLGGLTFTGFADASGAFAVTVPVTGNGYQLLAAWALDPVTGEKSPETTAVVRIDCQAPQVVEARLDRTTGVVRIVFSEAMRANTLAVGGAAAAVRVADADAPTTYQSGVLSLADSQTTLVQLDSGAGAWWRDRPVRLQVGPPAADAEGNPMAATYETVFFPGGGDLAGGFLFGEAFDDTSGRPLAGAVVGLFPAGVALPGTVPVGQEGAPLFGAVTDARGRFVLTGEVPAGRYALVVAGPTTNQVYRRVSLRPGTGEVPFDSRLTPLAPAAGTVAPAIGGTVEGAGAAGAASAGGPAGAGALRFTADAAALPGSEPVTVRLTRLSEQGLPDFLPLGWTPAAAAEVRLEQSAAPGQPAYALPEQPLWTSGSATLELPLPVWAGASGELFAARYEAATGRWLALPAPQLLPAVDGGPARARVELSGPGSVAVVIPDADAASRPPALPAAGEPLVGVERPAALPELTATLVLDPPVVGPTGRARARVVARSLDGSTPWPSGMAVQAYLEERLVLSGGGELLEAPFAADLVLYHSGLSAAEQATSAAAAVGAMEFAVSPSPRAAQVLLEVGWEHVRVFPFPEDVDRGAQVGPEGGTVDSPEGVVLTIPEGALTAKVPVSAELLSTSELAALPAVAGYDTVAAVRIDLAGAVLHRPATLSLPTPAGTPADSPASPRVVLAELVSAPADGRGAFAEMVSRTQRQGSGAGERLVAAPELAGALPLDGILREGVYLVLAAHQPLGFATGFVRGGNEVPVAGSRVTAEGLGTADLSAQTGRYAVPVPAGAQRRLVGRHPALDEQAEGTIADLPAGAVVVLDLSLAVVPPRVLGTTPSDGATGVPLAAAVSVLMNEPLAPATVTGSTLRLELAGPDGEPTGVSIDGTVSLLDGTRIVFTPNRPLLPGRRFRAVFAGGVADAGGAIYSGAPLVWTFATSSAIVPGGQVDPTKFHVRVPVGGVAEIYGDPGALPGTLPGQTPWAVSPEIEGPVADPQRDTFQGRADGSFSGTVGHPPGFAVTIGSRVWVKVFDPTGALAAEFRVGPFTTPDGLGFVAPAGEAVTFRSAQGHVVDVPAGAFGKATLVTIRNLDPGTVGVPTPQGLGLGGYVRVDFEGEANETLRVHVPAPAGVADGAQVFVGAARSFPWGRRLQVLSVGGVIERGGQRFLSNDPSVQPEPTASALGAVRAATGESRLAGTRLPSSAGRTCQQARQEGLPRCFLQSLLMEFTYRSDAAFYYEQGSDWALLAGFAPPFSIGVGAGLEAIANNLADAWTYVSSPHDWNGGFVLPVLSGEPLELVRRDVATGWILSQKTYDPVGGTDGLIDIGLLGSGSAGRPMLIDARPFQVYRFAAPPAGDGTRLSLEIEAVADELARVKLEGVEGFALPVGTSVAMFDLAPSEPADSETTPEPPIAGPSTLVCDAATPWSLGELAGSEAMLAVVGPGDLASTALASIELQFDRPLEPVSERPPSEVARLLDLGPTAGCGASPAAGYPRSVPLELHLAESDSRLVVVPTSSLPAGHRFRLEIVPTAIVTRGSAGSGASYWETAPVHFDFATRKVPGDPISGMPEGPALGTTSVARDMLMLGNLLLVASETGDLVAIDTSRVAEPTGLRRHALENRGLRGATRALATDGHNRVFYTGLFGSIWAVKALRLEEVRAAAAPCVDAPEWASGLPCFDGTAGSVRIAYALGSASGTTASEWLANGSLPEATPMDLDVLAQDEKGRALELADFASVYRPGGTGLSGMQPDGEGIYTLDVVLSSTLQRSRSGALEPSLPPGSAPEPAVAAWREVVCDGEEAHDRYQRATIDNLTTGQSWSVDLENPWSGGGGDGRATVNGIRARRGDRLQVRYNLRALGHVALMGSGITVVDLNRFYRLPGATQAPGSGQCGRRLGKFEGQSLEIPSCAPAGAALDGIAMTPSLATHSHTGCEGETCRGKGVIDVYSPLQSVGVVHTRSTLEAPGGVKGGLFQGPGQADGLQLSELAACIQRIGGELVQLRDVTLANDVEWLHRGVHGQLDGTFQPPAAGFTPRRVRGDLAFLSLGRPGVYVFDVSDRSLRDSAQGGSALIGRLSVPGHTAYRLQVDPVRNLLFAGGTDSATGAPVIDVWDIGAVNGGRGLAVEPVPLASLNAPWSTNHLGIDPAGTGLIYTWGSEKGAVAVPFDRPQVLLMGLYRPEGETRPRGFAARELPTGRFAALSSPATLEGDAAAERLAEEKVTAAFKIRVALPGSLGPELTFRVDSLRALPTETAQPAGEPAETAVAPGGPGWPEGQVVVRLRRIGADTGETGAQAGDGASGPLSSAFHLYESVETVLLIGDPRAARAYRRQDIAGTDADEKGQCRRCTWPGYLPDPTSTDPALETVVEVLAGPFVRVSLAPTERFGSTVREATERAIDFFAAQGRNYPAPVGTAEVVGAAAPVPAPVQLSLAEPAQNASRWSAGEAGVVVSLAGGELLLTASDHRVEGRVMPFALTRHYRSGSLGYGPLGSAGWSSPVFAQLREYAVTGEVDYHDGRGNVWRFVPRTAPPPVTHDEDEAASYHAPEGLYLRLQKLAGGQGWRLLGRSHDVARFDRHGRLLELSDRHHRDGAAGEQGSRMRFRYDPFGQLVAAEDDLGRRYRFEYYDDPRANAMGGDGPRYGLLRRVTDFAGREVAYEYDDQRRLVRVRLPEVTNPVADYSELSYAGATRPTIAYSYDPSPGGVSTDPGATGALLHGELAGLRLAAVHLPDFVAGVTAVPRARFEYEQATGRLAKVAFPNDENRNAPGAAAEWSFSYSQSWPAATATVRAPWGHSVEHALEHGRTSRRREELLVYQPGQEPTLDQVETRFTYSDDGRLLSVDRADGSRTSHCYADGEGGVGCPGGEDGNAVADRLARGNAVASVTAALTEAAKGTAEYDQVRTEAAYQSDNLLTSLTDGEGRPVDLAVAEASGADATRFVAEAVSAHFQYDRYGRVAERRGGGAAAPTVRLGYGADARGRSGAGLVERVERGEDLWQRLGYDASGNVEEVSTSQGTSERADHDEWDRPVRTVSGLSADGRFPPVGAGECSLGEGAIVERGFDAAGHVVRERRLQDFVDPADGAVRCRWVESRFTYNLREQLVAVEQTHLASATHPGQVVAAPQLVQRREYDAHGRLVRERAAALTHPEVVTTYTYDGAGRIATLQRGAEGARQVGYDPLSRTVFATDGDQGVWRGRYDAWGRLYHEEQPTGAVARRSFDRTGAPLWQRVFDSDPTTSTAARLLSETRTHYTSFGAAERMVVTLAASAEAGAQPEVRVTENVFDGSGRVIEIWSGPRHPQDETRVDRGAGRREARIDYEPVTGRVVSERYGGGAAAAALYGVSYFYGEESKAPWPDRVTALESVPGREADGLVETSTTVSRRDALGRPIEERRSDGSVVASIYDRSGPAIRVRTGAGTQAETSFDGANRPVRVVRPNGRGFTAYSYDLDGSLLAEVTRSAPDSGAEAIWETRYAYDDTGRVATITYADGTIEQLTYHADSTVRTRQTRDGLLVTHAYDMANRLVSAVPSLVAGDGGASVPTRLDGGDAYSYDPLSRPTLLRRGRAGVSGHDGALEVLYPGYDLGSRPLAEVVGGRAPMSWRYDLWNRPVEVALPEGIARAAAGAFAGFSREYDSLDRLVDVSGLGSAGLSGSPLGATWAWGGAGRLYAMTTKGGVGTAARYGYHGGAGPQVPGYEAGEAAEWKLGTLTWGAGSSAPTAVPQVAWGSFGFGWRGNEGSPGDGAKLGRRVLGPDATAVGVLTGMGWAWGYDGGVRLEQAAAGLGDLQGRPPTGGGGEVFRYGYGPGDELERIVREAAGRVDTVETGSYGRILSRSGAPFAYDGAGRRLEDDRFGYRWDWRGQLVEVTVRDSWAAQEEGAAETPWAGHQVRYDYDALGRLARREHRGRVPAGGTSSDRPWIELREYVWEGDGLAAEVSWTTPERNVLRWRRTYVPGPAGLDDAVQVVVEIGDQPGNPFAGTTRVYTYLRDELGTVVGLLAEEETVDPQRPVVPARYLYTPFGEAHVESGPELQRARFDGSARAVVTAEGVVVEQLVADETAAAAGALALYWSLPLDGDLVAAGLRVERQQPGSGWTVLGGGDIAVGAEPDEGGAGAGAARERSNLMVISRSGWLRGHTYRVRLEPELRDKLGRSFGRQEVLEWRVPEATAGSPAPPVLFDKRYAARFESWEAAGDSAGGRFPGGQSALFQGVWTDPVSGLGYARARWYDARNASWLSEDPLLDVDSPNLYAFVGHRPNMGTDPLGLKSRAEKLAELAELLAAGGYRVGNRSVTHVWRFRNRAVSTEVLRVETSIDLRLLKRVDERFPGIEVPYNEAGFIEFEQATHRVVYDEVSISRFSGDSKRDVENAWRTYAQREGLTSAQIQQLRSQYTMHHDWEEGRLLMVDTVVHDAFKHTGGHALGKVGLVGSLVAGVLLPRASEAQQQGAGLDDKVVALGVDVAMLGPAGAAEAPQAVEAAGKWIGQGLWDHFSQWLQGIGASGDAKKKAVEQIEE